MSKTGLYVHIPFCPKKCFYCSFIVAIGQKKHQGDYASCLAKEMLSYKNFHFDTIYFGGGTPSQLNVKEFLFLMDSIRENFMIAGNAEITLELNPEDVRSDLLKCYQDCGVNRLSLGVQTFQDPYLDFLGRSHDHCQAVEAYGLIRKHGFDNVNLDLMYGFPDEGTAEIDRDISYLKKLRPDHISLYSLTLEQGSKFFVQGIRLPDQEAAAEQYVFVRTKLLDIGFPQYEVSNFSVPGKESVHNLNYWRGGNYIGLGVGAHSHMDGKRWWNISRVREYIQHMKSGQSVQQGQEQLTDQQCLSEALVFGLRVMGGIDIRQLQTQFGNLSEQQERTLKNLLKGGFLVKDRGILKSTVKGLLVLDTISEQLI